MPSVRAASPAPVVGNAESLPFSPAYWWAYLRQLFVLGSFFGIALTVSLVCSLLGRCFGPSIGPAKPQAVIRGLFRFWLGLAHRLGVFRIFFPEAPQLAALRGAIIAPNHPSLLDAVILLSVAPQTVCVVRASLNDHICLGGAVRLARFVANDVGPILIRQGVEKIEQGENLLIFPEGTRTTSPGALNPFKKGFALIAEKTGAPIQTVFVERASKYLGKGTSLLAPTQLPLVYHLHLGEVFCVRENETAQQLSARLEAYFGEHLERDGDAIRLSQPVS